MSKFTVIKGGLPDYPQYEFLEASITDTRLMGVLGLRVHYVVYPIDPFDLNDIEDEYHFYYYDIEELGLDYLNVYELKSEQEVETATRACFGGLGAQMMPLTEEQALYMIHYFIDGTLKKGQPLPNELEEIMPALGPKPVLTKAELDDLNDMMCVPLATDYAAVNYYLMRCFGKDEEGARLLINKSAKEEDIEQISLKNHATFLKNSIQIYYNIDESVSYLSESLVESDDKHYIVTSEIKLAAGKVIYAKKKSQFAISLQEASMILSRREYCNVYRILVPMEDFDVDFSSIAIGTTKTAHPTGDMFMEFKPDNNHVEKAEFKLYNDLAALYYVSDYGELIVASYTLGDMMAAEKKIINSPLTADIALAGRLQFQNSLVYEFAQSGFTSFGEFIKSLE